MLLWIFPANSSLKKPTFSEAELALTLPPLKARQFLHSRGYARYALSFVFQQNPLLIPLSARPGKAPELKEGWGYISLSHCEDALLIGWSNYNLGVDIERKDRFLKAREIANRFFSAKEINYLAKLNSETINDEVLKLLTTKEAAIKWQRGSMAKDLCAWECNLKDQQAYHNKSKEMINASSFEYKNWYIGVASKININTTLKIFNE